MLNRTFTFILVAIMHLVSGSLASVIMTKRSKEVRRNQIIMMIVSIMTSQLQTLFLSSQIKKRTH